MAASQRYQKKARLVNKQLVDLAVLCIRRKLESAPHSVDTVKGIHSFWIQWEEPVPPETTTLEALERLEVDGVVERVTLDTQELWTIRKESQLPASA
ncbi:hypothetical protein [Polaromonas sp.]|uniref:hypothetical protein n=1 Tax=Polaromonas sp. TaxID=1869339 RepID=UPI003266FAED